MPSHTAGLPLHSHFFYADRPGTPPSMDETVRRYGVLVFPPGRTYEYSNLGYGILGHVIERASGRPYAEFMRRELFAPSGMTHTAVGVSPGLEDSVAVGYDELGRPIPSFTFDHPGASSVFSSAHDLVRFAMFQLKNRLPEQRPILGDATVDLMRRPAPPSSEGLRFAVLGGDGPDRRRAAVVAPRGPGPAARRWQARRRGHRDVDGRSDLLLAQLVRRADRTVRPASGHAVVARRLVAGGAASALPPSGRSSIFTAGCGSRVK